MALRRVVDLSLKLTPAVPLETTVPFTHMEPADQRLEAVRIFRLEPFHFGTNGQDIAMDVTINADLGSHLEVPYLDIDQIFGRSSPRGWLTNGPADIPIAQTIGEAAILDFRHLGAGQLVSAAEMEKASRHVRPGDIAFCLSGHNEKYDYNDWSSWRECQRNQPGFTPEANEVLVAKGIKAFGFDHHGMEGPGSYLYDEHTKPQAWMGAAHKVILYASVALFEHLTNLSKVGSERTLVLALPMRVSGVSGTIARVIALTKEGRIVDLSPAFRPFPGPDISWPSAAFDRSEPVEFLAEFSRRILVDGYWIQPVPPLTDKTPVAPDYGCYFTFSSRIGTHIAAPYHHLMREGLAPGKVRDAAGIPLERCLGEAVLLDLHHVGPGGTICVRDLKRTGVSIRKDDIVLVRTGYCDRHYYAPGYFENTPGLSLDAIDWLTEKQIKMIGVDTASIVPGGRSLADGTANEAYVTLFAKDVYATEGLCNLGQLSQQRFFFASLPVLSGYGLDASPARAIAIENFRWP